MNVAICDDEKQFRDSVHGYIRDYNRNFNVYLFENGRDLLDSTWNFDIIFLDISMPGIDGMETAVELRKRKSRAILIFLTSHTEHVFNAFKVDAFRFLNKPVSQKDFIEAVSEAEKKLVEELKITVRHGGETFEMYVSDIIYFEGYGDGTYVYLSGGAVYESSASLKEWSEKLLSKGFYRINRNHLISINKVQSFCGNEIVLKGTGEKFVISRRLVSKFREYYIGYIKNNSRFI